MPPLRDPEQLACYRAALANWRFEGYITFKEVAIAWARKHLPGITERGLAQDMYEHVAAGGEIDQQRETRPDWMHFEYHYDLRLRIGGRLVYIETTLDYDDPDDPDNPIIDVVSIHDA